MARLTKYDSFDALKAAANRGDVHSDKSDERQLAFEKFAKLLQNELGKKKGENFDQALKKRG